MTISSASISRASRTICFGAYPISWIVFWSDRASDEATKGALYLTTANGEIVERLTHEPELWHFAPSWQPLGRRTG